MALFDFLGSIAGDILGVGANIFGANQQSNAAKDAANTQASAANSAIAEQRRQFETTRADMQPWMTSGRNALTKLDQLLGVGGYDGGNVARLQAEQAALQSQYDTLRAQPYSPARDQAMTPLRDRINAMSAQITQGVNAAKNMQAPANYGELLRDFSLADFQADPGYQFRLGEGSKAIENSAAARGMQLSGANLKGLQRYNQDFASNEYGNAWNRDSLEKQRKFNFLTGQSGTGQQTAGSIGALGANTSGNVADAYLQAGNARAAGQVGSANAWGNAIGDVTDYYRMRNLLRAPSASSSGGYSGAAPGYGATSSLGRLSW
jgi:hypothetical protein